MKLSKTQFKGLEISNFTIWSDHRKWPKILSNKAGTISLTAWYLFYWESDFIIIFSTFWSNLLKEVRKPKYFLQHALSSFNQEIWRKISHIWMGHFFLCVSLKKGHHHGLVFSYRNKGQKTSWPSTRTRWYAKANFITRWPTWNPAPR